NFRTLGQHRHGFGCLSVAGDLQLGHLLDFDETHATIAGDRELRMVTVVGDNDPRVGRRLDDGLALGRDDLAAVNNDVYRVHIEDWVIGVKEYWSIAPPPITPSLLSRYRAALFRNMRFKLVAVFLDKRCRRHSCRIAERTNRIPHDVAADVENQIEIALLARAVLDAVKNLFHPVTAFAARAALAAGFVSEKTSEVPRGADHARGIVHDDYSAGAEQASRRLDGLVIEIHLF